MYQPKHFQQTDPERIESLIKAHPFAAIVRNSEGMLTADHIPMLVERQAGDVFLLKGHVARANPLWQFAAEVLVIFQGPEGYVSPSWYAEKARSGKVVPTWNYALVHCHGRLKAVEDRAATLAVVSALTDHHEAARSAPWRVADAPADYVDRLLAAIVAIEISVEKVEAKWKVSQNRPVDDRAGVVGGLLAAGTADARAMANLVSGADPT